MSPVLSRRTRRWLLLAAVVFWCAVYLLTLLSEPSTLSPRQPPQNDPLPAAEYSADLLA